MTGEWRLSNVAARPRVRSSESAVSFWIARRLFGHDHGSRTEEAVAQLVAFAELLDDLAFRCFGGFFLRHGLMPVGIERPARGVDLLEPGVGQSGFQLLMNHRHAVTQRAHGLGGAI